MSKEIYIVSKETYIVFLWKEKKEEEACFFRLFLSRFTHTARWHDSGTCHQRPTWSMEESMSTRVKIWRGSQKEEQE